MAATMTFTPREVEILAGLVSRAADEESARVDRMVARPQGSHTEAKIDEAVAFSQELQKLDRKMLKQYHQQNGEV
jgi:hypothetical protein